MSEPAVPQLPQIPPGAQMPPGVFARLMSIVCSYLLYERKEQTELSIAFEALVAERHEEFHKDHKVASWRECGNQICTSALQVLERARAMEISIHPLAAQLMNRYQIGLNPTPDALFAKLIPKEEKAVVEIPSNRPSGGTLIIP